MFTQTRMVDSMYVNHSNNRSHWFPLLKYKQIHLFRRYMYSNASHMMFFVSDIYRYFSISLGKVSGDFGLFKMVIDTMIILK